jgi:hypothetical protein
MLAYVLALGVGLESLGLYLAAFLFPEIHRKYDLIWSGVGLFYALVLWVCAGRISGAVLLGQIASVALLSWLGWQTLTLRLAQTPMSLRTQLPESATSAAEVAQLTVQQLRSNLQQSAGRSSLVAQLDRGIARLEQAWLELRSWANAWADTASSQGLSNHPTDLKQELNQELNQKPDTAENLVYAPPDFLTTDFLASESKFDPNVEPSAEWSDLEPETYPDLDTIDAPAPPDQILTAYPGRLNNPPDPNRRSVD